MKYCPTCQTRYDDEILRFCIKDGSPLIDEDQPEFTGLPSETEDDEYGAETVIRRKTPEPQPGTETADVRSGAENAERIIIPTSETDQDSQQVRARTTPSIRSQPPVQPQSNMALVVATTILGTIVVLAGAFGVFWLLSNQGSEGGNQNVNANFNSLNGNLNSNIDNINFDFNSNANLNTNFNGNLNLNLNTNLKTPTPTPSPSPSPSPTPTPAANTNTGNANAATPTPSPIQTPRPRSTPPREPTPGNSPVARPANGGILNSRAVSLETPSYPTEARSMQASGRVQVQVLVDEFGNVDAAKAISGHPLLRASAETAARRSRFDPIKINGRNVQTTGLVIYNFIRPN